jgi:LysR family transcriptional regulator, glycine cleavage system transcriptional activator
MSGLGRLIPSPRTLLIFEAAARAGSCSAAAREFNLTQPSVSRNIATLESLLGTPLFTRSHNGMTLTQEGQHLHAALAEGFQRVESAIREIIAQQTRKQVVELSLSTAFVTHWLIPRLREFHEAFPEVDLRFQLISGTLRGPPGNVDLAMRMMSADAEANYHSWPFGPEFIIPVCSPAYLRSHGTLERPVVEKGHVLLHLSDPLLDWEKFWGGTLASRRTPNMTWIEFSDYAVVLQAAMNGEGIALGWVTAASRALSAGKLVAASARRIRTGRSYHLYTPRSKPVREVVFAIRDWLVREMQQDLNKLGKLVN